MKAIKFNPTFEEEIEQNIQTIIQTIAGSAPLGRAFGLEMSAVDEVPVVSQARLTGQIATAIARYEPRVQVTSITFNTEQEHGKSLPTVIYRIKEAQRS